MPMHVGLGAVASGDWGAIYSVQRNESRRVFGPTSIHLPGRTDINYPNLSGEYALRLIKYWVNESQRVLDKTGSSTTGLTSGKAGQVIARQLFGSEAHFLSWERAVIRLRSMIAIRTSAAAHGKRIMPEDQAKILWDNLDGVVLPMKAIEMTPSEWELFESSVSWPGWLPRPPGLPDLGKWMKIAMYGTVAYLAYSVLGKSRRRD